MEILKRAKYIFIKEMFSLKRKLQILENNGVTFRAAYMGYEEVFTAVYPDGTFMDYHWMESTDSKDCQFFNPTEFERVVDETLKYGIMYGWVDQDIQESIEQIKNGEISEH